MEATALCNKALLNIIPIPTVCQICMCTHAQDVLPQLPFLATEALKLRLGPGNNHWLLLNFLICLASRDVAENLNLLRPLNCYFWGSLERGAVAAAAVGVGQRQSLERNHLKVAINKIRALSVAGDNPKRWGWGGAQGRAEKDMVLRQGMRGSPFSRTGRFGASVGRGCSRSKCVWGQGAGCDILRDN